jgi:two-component system response regulator HydG
VVALRIPPLRDRRDDIPLLASHFLNRMSRNNGTKYVLSDDALRTMSEYAWPGNVRELENSIERACALSSGPVLRLGDLPTQLQDFHLHTWRAIPSGTADKAAGSFDVTPLADLERQAILDTLRQLNGDKLTAARLLGIGKTTLYRKLKEYGIRESPASV